MKKLKSLLFAVFIFGFVNNAITQSTNNPFILYSKKKISYFELTNGVTMEGYIRSYDSYKGFIEKIRFIDKDGKKHIINAKDINRMFLYPSTVSKLIFTCEFIKEPTFNIEDEANIVLSNGYVMFESSEVYLKGKKGRKKYFLLPVLNPSYSDKIKIFPDPDAYTYSKTKIVGVTTKKVLSSYYVKKGDLPAFKITRWNYKKVYKELYKGCSELENMTKPHWSAFKEHIFQYSKCNEEL